MKEQNVECGVIDKIKKGLPASPSFIASISKITPKAKGTVLDLTDENNSSIKAIIEGKYEADIGSTIKITSYHLKIVDGTKLLIITAHEKTPNSKKPENKKEKTQPVEESKIPPKVLPSNDTSTMNPYTPIKDINMNSKQFTIKGKVIEKYPIKQYKNEKGEGSLLKFDVADETSSIEVICFNEMAHKFDSVQKGGIYCIKNGCIMQSNKFYSNTKSDFKIKLDKCSEVTQSQTDIKVIKQKCNFKSAAEITLKDCGQINVIGIVSEVYDAANITSKTGKSLCKRVIMLTDESNKKLEVTLWDKQAQDEEFTVNSVVAFRNAIGSIYNQKLTIKIVQTTTIIRDPDDDRKAELDKYASTLSSVKTEKIFQGYTPKSYSNSRVTIQKLKALSESKGADEEDKNYYSVIAEVENISKKKPFYNGCSMCQKKVNLEGLKYKCEKCNKFIDKPIAIYFLGVRIFDYTGVIFVNLFNEKAANLLHIPAEKIKDLYDSNKESEAMALLERVKCEQYNFIINTKRLSLSYNSTEQITYNVARIESVDYKAENELLINDIQSLLKKQ